jgi:hypothetical protein
MRVDHYTASVETCGSEALAWACEAVPIREQILVGRDGAVPRYRYDHAVAIQDGKSVVAVVRWGGNGESTSIELKGSIANETYGLLRSHWPDHRVSRLDVAVDGTAPGLFRRTFDAFELIRSEMPANRRPKLYQRGDWTELPPKRDGLSAYYGSKDSEVQVVLYEKGWERETRGGLTDQDRDWTRLELRVTPLRRESKTLLSGVSPSAAWGWSEWSARWLEAFQGMRPSRVELPARQRDDDRAYGALLSQYGALLDKFAAGDWSGLGERLGRDLKALQGLKKGSYRAA